MLEPDFFSPRERDFGSAKDEPRAGAIGDTGWWLMVSVSLLLLVAGVIAVRLRRQVPTTEAQATADTPSGEAERTADVWF